MTDPLPDHPCGAPELPDAGYHPVPPGASAGANRDWWDADAEVYHTEHGAFLGDADFVWCPEGLRESRAGLLGDVVGCRVLDIGCGQAQTTRWLRAQGSEVVGLDLSAGMIGLGRLLDESLGTRTPLLQAEACALPFASASFDTVCSAYGAVPFVEDSAALMREVARVLRPKGRWVFSVTHPLRWAFPDDPGERGLTAVRPYFDRSPYVEAQDGLLTYAEHHRTLGDRVRELVAAGFVLSDLIEPEWPRGHERTWGGWSPLRGRLLPGTAIFVSRLG